MSKLANNKKTVVGPITKRTQFNQAGQQSEVYEIHFISPGGVRDHITVDEEDYQPEGVKALIAAKVKIHDAITE